MAEQNAAGPHQATGPLAGEPRQRGGAGGQPAPSPGSRALTWLTWWILLMGLWVAVDDSIQFDELLAGAGAAALAAVAAEVAGYQAASRYGVRAAWLATALRLPGRVARDTFAVFAALARTLAGGDPPDGAFREISVPAGDDSPRGVTRRVLLTGAQSLTPNAFVIGIDTERDVMIVHELVTRR